MLFLIIPMIYRVGFIILLAIIFSKITLTKAILQKRQRSLNDKISIGVLFGVLGIMGTVTGISFQDAIINTRVIGVTVGGLLGGPLTGLIAGLIAGLHRYLIDMSGFTSLSCSFSTVLEGILAGYLSNYFENSSSKILFSILVGFLGECLQMIIIITFSKPFNEALNLAKIISLPMIFINSAGIGLFISVINNIRKLGEIEGAYRSYQTLLIADKTLKYLGEGLNHKSAQKITEIIYKSTNFDAVAITDLNIILAHKGVGEDHHLPGEPIKTSITRQVLNKGMLEKVNSPADIDCNHCNCKLKSGIIVPLKIGKNVVGTLKLYNPSFEKDSMINIEMARGLGNIFSNQLYLSKVKEYQNLKTKAELHALQAQISPHFLFNSINTIVSFIRTDSQKARELLIDLSSYFRYNIHNEKDFIELKEELRHLTTYIKIEKARFDDRLSFCLENNILENVYIPPLIIQPLVENSIKHGILKQKQGGLVKVVLDMENRETIKVRVEDNGQGMKDSALLLLRERILEDLYDGSSIGLINVYRRLKIAFNNCIIFTINSRLDEGTVVEIEFPKLLLPMGERI